MSRQAAASSCRHRWPYGIGEPDFEIAGKSHTPLTSLHKALDSKPKDQISYKPAYLHIESRTSLIAPHSSHLHSHHALHADHMCGQAIKQDMPG